jgi:CDP-diacylglycerol--glycerol-3-phosphate 3-phosphatidyltransferase
MNIANQLTILRILLAFIAMALILKNTPFSLSCAFVVFLIASFTDFLDGFLARKKEIISDLGKILDPIADKILIIGVFLAFLELNIVNIWMVIAIMLREFIITGLRLSVLNKGVVLEARFLGKNKTVSQMAGIILIFVTLILYKIYPGNKVVFFTYLKIIPAVMWYVVVITIFSGVHYLWVNRKLIKTF